MIGPSVAIWPRARFEDISEAMRVCRARGRATSDTEVDASLIRGGPGKASGRGSRWPIRTPDSGI